ncbi:MAG: hypothetical protein V3R81_10460, partial [Gammaproteobacteria bacterium]
VAELNQATVGIITGTVPDPDRDSYLPWLVSDHISKVTVHAAEARHYATTRPDGHYDIIQASGVDTLTAISSGGKSLVENYLYTVEGVEEFMRILAPKGVLSLTHWRTRPPMHNLRMFLTYLEALERAGIEDAYRHVVVVGGAPTPLGPGWTDTMLRKEPWQTEEVERLRQWVRANGHVVLFNPTQPTRPPKGIDPEERIYWKTGFLPREQRQQFLGEMQTFVEPVVDDRPYFYQTRWVTNVEAAFMQIQRPVLYMFFAALLGALVLIFLPLLRMQRRDVPRRSLVYAVFFAMTGFAFLLFQTTIIQLFTVFVGGPVYSLAVVLVAVLAGYSIGSGLANYLRPDSRTFIASGLILGGTLLGVYLFIPNIIDWAMPWSFPARLALCGVITFVVSVLTGIPVPLAMSAVRVQHGNVVGWMWGISSAFNVLGAMSFVPLTQIMGISFSVLLAGGLYLLASIGLSFTPLVREAV